MSIIFIGEEEMINKNVEKSIEYIKKLNHYSGDIVTRIIEKQKIKIGYIYLESVSSDDKISDFLNKSFVNLSFNSLFNEIKNKIFNSHINTVNDYDKLFYYLASGYTAIFIEGYNEAIVIETKSELDRGVVEASSEPIVRGPKDSFTENHPKNIGLIRKRIKDKNLIFQDTIVGKRTKTKVSVAYIRDIANLNNVQKIIQKLNEIDIDGIIDSGYIRELLEENSKSIFPKMISTERPDLACTSLLEGRIVILVENTPFVLILPAMLIDFIHSTEDYYHKPLNATFNRFLRIICFFITILTPGLYVALMTFNPEIIPSQLLISLAIQRDGVPFSTAIEILIFVITFEMLREADTHSPSVSGSAMNIVGALILGDAAVNAGIVSPIVIIVVAVTSISELVFYDVDIINALREWRILFIISALLLGIMGFVIAGIILTAKLVSITCLNTPYLTPFSPLYLRQWADGVFRLPRNKLKYRASYLTKNTIREVEHETSNA